MREQLIQYVELLFAGAPNTTEIKQEILQNTLDRYDDLIEQGKTPEAAYRLAISGIGDINEIISGGTAVQEPVYEASAPHTAPEETAADKDKKLKRAVAVAMYILCPVPIIVLSVFGLEIMGVMFMFLLIAAATALLIMTGSSRNDKDEEPAYVSPKQQMRNSISKVVNAIVLAVYLVVSFSSGAWYITWIIFPIAGSVKGLIYAIMDLKEASDYEN